MSRVGRLFGRGWMVREISAGTRSTDRHQSAPAERTSTPRQLRFDGANDRRHASGRHTREHVRLQRHDRRVHLELHDQPNRWGMVTQAMTGNFLNGYHCAAMPRTPGSIFAQQYEIGGVAPYDLNYYLKFHVPIAKDTTNSSNPVPCVNAPGSLPGGASGLGVGPTNAYTSGSASAFPSGSIVQHTYGIAGTSSCTAAQDLSGAIDSSIDLMRFGLMTFDQDPSSAIGVSTATTPQVLGAPFTECGPISLAGITERHARIWAILQTASRRSFSPSERAILRHLRGRGE